MNAQAIDYQTIFQHAPLGMCISRQRVIQDCNDALARMFGYERAALLGKSFSVLYPTVDDFNRIGHTCCRRWSPTVAMPTSAS